jgi:thioredoxin-like negative regulator of GroEL
MQHVKLLAAALMAAMLSTGLAHAATLMPYSPAAFAAAEAAGTPVVVHVNAPWCPNCAKQRPILAALAKLPEFHDMLIMQVDFDSEKAVVRQFGVQMQSTLIAFHGKQERGRATAITDPAAIKALLEKAEG